MLLTGFDAPVEQVLYLDRALREHGLLQAIARVNRRFSRTASGVTTEKTYGLVVDYFGVSRELENALAAFDPEDSEDTLNAMKPLEEDPSTVIESAALRAESHFKGHNLDDTWACVGVFLDTAGDEDERIRVDVYEKFDRDYREFSRLMDQYLPDEGALNYVGRLARLTRIRAYVRAQYLRENADLDWTAISAKVRQLIDSRIDAEVRTLMKPVSILDQDFEAKISGLPHDEARASVMEHSIRAQIKELYDENPVFYQKLLERLAQIISEMRQKVIDAAEAVKQLGILRDEALSEAQIAAEHGLTEVSFALYEILEKNAQNGAVGDSDERLIKEQGQPYRTRLDEGLKGAALKLESILKRHKAIVDWHLKEDVQRELRRDIKRELRRSTQIPEQSLDEVTRIIVEVERRRSAR